MIFESLKFRARKWHFSAKMVCPAFPGSEKQFPSMPFHGTWSKNECEWFFRPQKNVKKRLQKNGIFVHE
jgi:hypothetical protein